MYCRGSFCVAGWLRLGQPAHQKALSIVDLPWKVWIRRRNYAGKTRVSPGQKDSLSALRNSVRMLCASEGLVCQRARALPNVRVSYNKVGGPLNLVVSYASRARVPHCTPRVFLSGRSLLVGWHRSGWKSSKSRRRYSI